MKRSFRRLALAALAVAATLFTTAAQAVLPQAGDVVFGLNKSDPTLTLELIRGPRTAAGGVKQTPMPWNTPWQEIIRFDNLGGTLHNAKGNLLGIDFGTTATGGRIYSMATSGAEPLAFQKIMDLNPADPLASPYTGATTTRLGVLGVSPNNTKLAVNTYERGTVLVYDYTSGNGLGTGASLANPQETVQFLDGSKTQGLVWKDNNTIVSFSSLGSILETNATTLNTTPVGSVTLPDSIPQFTSIAYRPDISPYMYLGWGGFVTPTTTNKLYVVNPATGYSLVKEIDLTTSAQTLRDFALDKDGNLFFSEFGNTTIGTSIQYIPAANVLNPATLTDNSSIKWYTSTQGASFTGIDIGFGSAVVVENADFDDNDIVDGADLLRLQRNLGLGSGATLGQGDANGDGAVNAADLAIFETQFGTPGGAAPAIGAIPEPSTVCLGLVATLALGRLRRRAA